MKLNIKDSYMFILCIVLSIFAFYMDLSIRWAIGGLFYIVVVLLSLQSSNKKHSYIVAILSSVLLITSLIVVPPTGQVLRVLLNHLLILIIIWSIHSWFLYYKAVSKLNSRFASVVNSSEDAIWSITLDGHISDWNESCKAMFDYSKEELIGKSTSVLIPQEEHSALSDILTKISNVKNLNTMKQLD
ncbi:MAG: PAS domain-containing protein [Candidatus Zapsychrus exili]|nr:PAS domain-containing protein [Candidatus Zapsychrus exili]